MSCRADFRFYREVYGGTALEEEAFREAFALGYTEPWQLAEYFELPERDVQKALTYWKDRRGVDFNK